MRDRGILEPTFEEYVIPRDFKRYPIKVNGVYGVATNDANYVTQIKETLPNRKRKLVWMCPAYSTWCNMLVRGYSQKYKEKFPTYQNVTVCENWLLFSNFRSWWVDNNVAGWQLEKDLLVKGNLIYSPETCVYVPNYLNTLLVDSAAARGDYPLGVDLVNRLKPYRSVCSVGGKNKHLGYFSTPQQAHKAWQVSKIKCIEEVITHYTEDANHLGVFDQRIVSSLEGRISHLQDDVGSGKETFVLH